MYYKGRRGRVGAVEVGENGKTKVPVHSLSGHRRSVTFSLVLVSSRLVVMSPLPTLLLVRPHRPFLASVLMERYITTNPCSGPSVFPSQYIWYLRTHIFLKSRRVNGYCLLRDRKI